MSSRDRSNTPGGVPARIFRFVSYYQLVKLSRNKSAFALALAALLTAVFIFVACATTIPETPDTPVSTSSSIVAETPTGPTGEDLSAPTPSPTPAGPRLPSLVASSDCTGLLHGVLPFASLTISSGDRVGDGFDITRTLQVEVADEPSERAQGLMCRSQVPSGSGMLFTYETDQENGFWMFNTYTPIDILYLDQSGTVVDIVAMTPCTRGPDEYAEWRNRCTAEAKKYVPSGPWRNTLELPAGWLREQGFVSPDGTGDDREGQEITVTWTVPQP